MNQYTSAIVGTALQNGILSSYFTDTIDMLQVSIYYYYEGTQAVKRFCKNQKMFQSPM